VTALLIVTQQDIFPADTPSLLCVIHPHEELLSVQSQHELFQPTSMHLILNTILLVQVAKLWLSVL